MKLALTHPDIVAIASRQFWRTARVEMGRSVTSIDEVWRTADEEYEIVRAAVEKGVAHAISAALIAQKDTEIPEITTEQTHPG